MFTFTPYFWAFKQGDTNVTSYFKDKKLVKFDPLRSNFQNNHFDSFYVCFQYLILHFRSIYQAIPPFKAADC